MKHGGLEERGESRLSRVRRTKGEDPGQEGRIQLWKGFVNGGTIKGSAVARSGRVWSWAGRGRTGSRLVGLCPGERRAALSPGEGQ